jgi:hypothetical protein
VLLFSSESNKMKKLIIYHLKSHSNSLSGIKVGCTCNLNKRLKQNQEKYGNDCVAEILEQFIGTNEQGTEREFFWADHFGYRRDTEYHVAVELQKKRSIGYRNKCKQMSFDFMEKEKKPLKPKEKKELLIKTDKNGFLHTEESKSKMKGNRGPQKNPSGPRGPQKNPKIPTGPTGKRGPQKNPSKITICPHCGNEGSSNTNTRYHFDNCKAKPCK